MSEFRRKSLINCVTKVVRQLVVMQITNAPSSFNLTQEFNGHFSGNASRPALGIILEEEFASRYDLFGLTLAPKFVYDIPVCRRMGI